MALRDGSCHHEFHFGYAHSGRAGMAVVAKIKKYGEMAWKEAPNQMVTADWSYLLGGLVLPASSFF